MKRYTLGLILCCVATAFASIACDDDNDKDTPICTCENCATQKGCTCSASCYVTDTETKPDTDQCNCSCKLDPACTCDKTCESSTPSLEDFDTETNEACDTSFNETCEGGIAHFCGENFKVIKRNCAEYAKATGTNYTCQKLKGDNYVDCVIPCDLTSFSDYNTCSGKYVENHICHLAEDEKGYEFSFTDEACPKLCSNGVCVDKIDNNTPKEGASCTKPTCYNDDVYNCVAGKYVKTTCTTGTTCMPDKADTLKCGEIKKVNTTCDPSTFVDFCNKNSLYYCNSGTKKVTQDPCDASRSLYCHYLADGYGLENYAECASPCTEGTEPLEQCIKGSNDTYYSDNFYCYPAKDSESHWFFPIQQSCTNGCDAEKKNCL